MKMIVVDKSTRKQVFTQSFIVSLIFTCLLVGIFSFPWQLLFGMTSRYSDFEKTRLERLGIFLGFTIGFCLSIIPFCSIIYVFMSRELNIWVYIVTGFVDIVAVIISIFLIKKYKEEKFCIIERNENMCSKFGEIFTIGALKKEKKILNLKSKNIRKKILEKILNNTITDYLNNSMSISVMGKYEYEKIEFEQNFWIIRCPQPVNGMMAKYIAVIPYGKDVIAYKLSYNNVLFIYSKRKVTVKEMDNLSYCDFVEIVKNNIGN